MSPAGSLREIAREKWGEVNRQERRVEELRLLARHYAERGFAEALRLREMEQEARDAEEAARLARRADRGYPQCPR